MHKPVSFTRTARELPQKSSGSDKVVCASCRYALEDDFEDPSEMYNNPLSLDTLFIQHPAATYFVEIGKQNDMSVSKNEFLGVLAGDVLTIDRALVPTPGRLVLAIVNGDFLIARFTEHNGTQFLVTDEPRKDVHELSLDENASVWGVVSAFSRKV